MRFPTNRLVVRDESLLPGRDSPSARTFARSLSTNFATLKEQIPSFGELQREAVLVSLARWMLDRHIPVDRAWLQAGPESPTPMTTPSVTVLRSSMMDRLYLAYGIHGGVDFQRPNNYATRRGVAALMTTAISKRPARARTWATSQGGRSYRAVALRVSQPRQMLGATPWQRIMVPLPQPRIERFVVPSAYTSYFAEIDIQNNTFAPLTVQLIGPVSGSFTIPSTSRHQIGVSPGTYSITASAQCGMRSDAARVQGGTVSSHQYECRRSPE